MGRKFTVKILYCYGNLAVGEENGQKQITFKLKALLCRTIV